MSYPNFINKQIKMKIETRLSGILKKKENQRNTRTHAEQKAYMESIRRKPRSNMQMLFWMQL